MKNNGDEIFLRHILDAIKRISGYLEGINYDEFIDDDMRTDAVVRQIEIIGEATKNLSTNFKKKHPKIPWKEIAGMRDKLIHGYFGVDLEIVWKTCRDDLVSLKKSIKRFL